MENTFERFFKEAHDLRTELSIDDSTVYTLNEEVKRQSILAMEFLILYRMAKKRYNELLRQENLLIAKLIKKICDQAQVDGKTIASTAKGMLIKTDIPLYPIYQKLKKELNEAEEEMEFLKSIQYIISRRGDLLQESLRFDRQLIKNEAAYTDTDYKADVKLFEKKMNTLIETDESWKNFITTYKYEGTE